MRVPDGVLRLAARVRAGAWWLRSVDLGVRVVAIRDDEAVLLVEHTYVPGWYLPGGAVDRGETTVAAAERELAEETGWRCPTAPVLHGIFRAGRRGHVLCYVVRSLAFDPSLVVDSREIAAVRFFPLGQLPETATRATRARIAEVTGGGTPALDW